MALWHLLLRTRLNASNPYSLCYLLSHSQSQFLNPPCFSSLSTAPAPAPDATPQSPTAPNTSSLSARMSFIFDQIDEIDKKRQDKDDALQRIRTWRESKKQQGGGGGSAVDSVQGAARDELKPDLKKSEELLGNAYAEKSEESLGNTAAKKEVELVHPWPEWIELMERLVQQNYFDDKRKDEDGMIKGLGFDLSDAVPAEDGRRDFMRDFWTVQSAVVNFGRDRFDILKSLSRQDLQILVGFGCPSMDKRIVYSGKLLRKHTHLDEGDVCSSCSLRNSCEKAYLLTNKEDEARTLDVMRILLAYGFDPTNESYINQSILKRKSVKTVVRKVLRDVVRLSAIPIDPNLPPPVIKRPPPKVKQPPPPKKRIGRADVEMKKGDWLCPKCDFLNFAKNTVCLQCDAKRPKRQLLPGEWECPECNFLNYRRNTACFHCEHKRPPDTYTENQFPEKQHGPRISLEKVDRKDISNAWNFDFDDDESDGADVAAFEYADSRKLAEDFPSGNQNLREDDLENSRRPNKGCEDGMENSRRPNKGYEDGMENSRRPNKGFEREYSDSRHGGSGIGFNDFDDEDDGIDSYELVDDNEDHEVPRVDFSEIRVDSESEDIESPEGNWRPPGKTQFRRQSKKQMHRKPSADSDDGGGDFDTDDDLPVHPDWKSSHVADNKRQSRGRSAMKFVSDDDIGFDSDSDDETAGLKKKVNRRDFNAKNRTPRGRSNFKSESFSEAGSDDDLNYRSPKQRKESGRNRPGNTPRNRSGMVSRSNKKTSPNRGFSRSGTQGRSNNSENQSASYLDDERYQRPRRNVR